MAHCTGRQQKAGTSLHPSKHSAGECATVTHGWPQASDPKARHAAAKQDMGGVAGFAHTHDTQANIGDKHA